MHPFKSLAANLDLMFTSRNENKPNEAPRYIKEGIPFKHGPLVNMSNNYIGLIVL